MGRPQDTPFNLDKALRIVPPDAADEICAFREAQNGLTPEKRWERCRKKRDGLLESHTKLASVFACYGLLFQTERRHRRSDKAWQDFDAVIREQEASRRLRCLVVISDKWGEEVVRHYGFSSRPRRYCDDLRTVANLCPAWRDAATRLNNSMCQRLRSTDRRIPGVSNAINPIESWDLQHVKTAACQEPMPHNLEIPHGYGLDRFGLLVHQDIAAASADMSHNTTHNPMPNRNRATFVSATAAHIAFDPPPISCTGLFPSEAAQSLPTPSMTDIRTAGGIALPFPPSPPSSPDTGPATSLLLTAESEQRLPSNGKRAAAKHLDRATKKQRTLGTVPSVTATNPSDSSARSDAREILDLLAKLQSRGSPLANQPQFARSLEWARAQSEKDERTHHEITAGSRHSAPSFLERVLLPSLGRQDAGQSSQQGPVPPNRVLPPALSRNPSQAGQVRAGQRSEFQGSDGFQDASLLSTSFVIDKEQAIRALESQHAHEFMVVTLDVALDHEGGMGSFITFTISKEAAYRLATCRGDTMDNAVAFSRPASVSSTTRQGVFSALDSLSCSYLNMPAYPNLPFITLWFTRDVGQHIVMEHGGTS